MRTAPFVVALLFGLVKCQVDNPDFVASMPDAPAFRSNTYSGYLTADTDKQLHYMFAESLDNPNKDPLVFWFNGGPGCSSMLAFMQEHGPNVVDDFEAYLKPNPWPWNMQANVAYIESPAGVGFSYVNGDIPVYTDEMVAGDSLQAVLSWFKKFPQFKHNDVYIAGESYGGMYVPWLSRAIYENNMKLPEELQVNLKGFMVGNGATNFQYDIWPSYPEVIEGLQMIPTSLKDQWFSDKCHRYFHNITAPEGLPAENWYTTPCNETVAKMNNLTTEAGINWYDLYKMATPGGLMAEEEPKSRYATTIVNGQEKTYKVGYTQSEYTPWLKPRLGDKKESVLADYVSHYLNREDVREAFHIPADVPAWETCNGYISNTYDVNPVGSHDVYTDYKGKMKMLFYCGDTDGAVPCWGTRQWIKAQKRVPVMETTTWHVEDEFSGQITRYDGLDFVTIHGAGHLVPQWKRRQTTTMITAWLHDEEFW